MKKTLILCTAFALLVGILAGMMFANLRNSGVVYANGTRTVHVVERAITDTVQEFHPPNMSLGDVLGFHNPVFNAEDERQVGHDNGQCTRTVAKGKTEWECFWTTFLAGPDLISDNIFSSQRFVKGSSSILTQL